MLLSDDCSSLLNATALHFSNSMHPADLWRSVIIQRTSGFGQLHTFLKERVLVTHVVFMIILSFHRYKSSLFKIHF